MSIKDQENIEELRKRLYERGGDTVRTERHSLSPKSIEVSRGWNNTSPVSHKEDVSTSSRELEKVDTASDSSIEEDSESEVVFVSETPKRSYRKLILIFSFGVFLLAVLVSGIYMFLGSNQISGNNINVAMSVPFSVAGGDVLPIQLSVTNQNSVAIESATLIINYPRGTKSADEDNKDLYEERIPIERIEAGQVLNIPAKAILFGEENEEKQIKATIEYRVVNSNGTFYKESAPVVVKINSSPLVLRVNSVEKISSGQEMEITLTVQSNSTSPMKDILISATYPNTFSSITSEPAPSHGQGEWLIDEILPNNTYIIKIRGLVSGLASESSEIQFKAGNAKADNQFTLGSVLTQTKLNYQIEEPFIGVVVNMNNDSDGKAVLNPADNTDVTVTVNNTLDQSVYDMRVELLPIGNMVRDNNLSVSDGYFDSGAKKISWEISSMSSLEQVKPGESRDFKFMIDPDVSQSAGAFNLSVKVFARRVNEANASEELIGTAVAEAKYSSSININSEVAHLADDEGSIPPVANKKTEYTITLEAVAGVNDLTKGVLTTSLPQYVSWLNEIDGEGKIEFNPVSKQLIWEVGDISARKSKLMKVKVALLPSVTHIGRTLTLIENQDFRAKDRFTEETLQVKRERLGTDLSAEQGFGQDSGLVKSE